MTASPSKGNMDQFRTMVRKVLAYKPPDKKDPPPQAEHRKSSKQPSRKQVEKTLTR